MERHVPLSCRQRRFYPAVNGIVPVRHRRLLSRARLGAATNSHQRNGSYRHTGADTADVSGATCANAGLRAPIDENGTAREQPGRPVRWRESEHGNHSPQSASSVALGLITVQLAGHPALAKGIWRTASSAQPKGLVRLPHGPYCAASQADSAGAGWTWALIASGA